jgi:F-type H+-transporting ATPase subunit delta
LKISKQARREAKGIFRAAQVNGQLDEGRLAQAVKMIAEQKPRGYMGVLSHLQYLVRLDIERHTAKVESAAAVTPELESSVRRTLTQKYGPGLNFSFQHNPALLGGLRIRVGSDVYDGTVSGRLKQLEEDLA